MEFPFFYKIRKVPTRPTPPTPNNFVQYGGRGAGPPQNSQGPPQNCPTAWDENVVSVKEAKTGCAVLRCDQGCDLQVRLES